MALFVAVAGWPSASFASDANSGPYASSWSAGAKSAVRLIAARAPGRPYYNAGVEMRLDPGALTYWRSPGEAGAPPVFSFAGSENVADVAVFYPAPRRIDESGTEAFGYVGDVTFPIHVKVIDETRPASLALTLRYAVCERVCLPSQAEAKLPLPPAAKTPAAGADAPLAAIAAAEAKVPVRLSDRERNEIISVVVEREAARPTWRLTLKGGGALNGAGRRGEGDDLFAEGPEGWYYETHATERPDEFRIVEVERPKTQSGAAPPVLFTLTRSDRSYEFAMQLQPAPVEH